MKTFEPMVIGAKVTFSVDSKDQLPPSATLSSWIATEVSGGEAITIENLGQAGSKANMRVEAIATGVAQFRLLYTFSNGDKDGEMITVTVL